MRRGSGLFLGEIPCVVRPKKGGFGRYTPKNLAVPLISLQKSWEKRQSTPFEERVMIPKFERNSTSASPNIYCSSTASRPTERPTGRQRSFHLMNQKLIWGFSSLSPSKRQSSSANGSMVTPKGVHNVVQNRQKFGRTLKLFQKPWKNRQSTPFLKRRLIPKFRGILTSGYGNNIFVEFACPRL